MFITLAQPTNDYGQGNFISTSKTYKVIRYITCIIVGFILFSLPIVSLFIGINYWYNCPIQPMIPAYLVIVGAISCLRNVFALKIICSKRATVVDGNPLNERNEFMILIDAILISWFIIGTVWTIYVAAYRTSDSSSEFYCHPVLFIFTCVLIFGVYAIAVFSIIYFLIYYALKEASIGTDQDIPLPSYEQASGPRFG